MRTEPRHKNFKIWLQHVRVIQTTCDMPIFPNFDQNGLFDNIFRHYAPRGHSGIPNFKVKSLPKIVWQILWYPPWPFCMKWSKMTAVLSMWPGFWTWCPNENIWSPFTRTATCPKNFKIWFLHFRAIRTVYHMWYFRNVSQIGHFMDNYSSLCPKWWAKYKFGCQILVQNCMAILLIPIMTMLWRRTQNYGRFPSLTRFLGMIPGWKWNY